AHEAPAHVQQPAQEIPHRPFSCAAGGSVVAAADPSSPAGAGTVAGAGRVAGASAVGAAARCSCGWRRSQLPKLLSAGLRSPACAGVRRDGGGGSGSSPSVAGVQPASAAAPAPAQLAGAGAASSGSTPSGSLPSSQASKILRAIGAAVLPP